VLWAAFAATAGCAPTAEELYARAQRSLGEGNAAAAVVDLKSLVESQPENPQARALLARALIANREIGAGEIELTKAKDLGAPPSLTLASECQVWTAKSQFDAVLGNCNPETVSAESRVDVLLSRGSALLGVSRAAEARQAFDQARAVAPQNLDALLGAAGAVQQLEGPRAAMTVLDGASEELRKNPRYWLSRAGLAAADSDYAAAESAYKTSLALLDKHDNAGVRILALGGLSEVQLRQGDVAGAEVTTSKLVALAPTDPGVRQLRGQSAAAAGKYDEARDLLEKLVSDFPENYEARLLLGMVNAQQGNLGQAEMQFSAVVANQPDNVRAYGLLAEVRRKLGNPHATLAELKASFDPASADASMLAMAGRLSLADGNRNQALAYVAEASKGSSAAGPEVQLEIANGYLVAGETDRALDVLRTIGDSGKIAEQRDALLLLALLRKGDEAELMKQAQAVLARSPSNANIRNVVGSVYAAAGKPNLAREQFGTALALNGKYIQSRMNLARLDLAEKNFDAAGAQFQKILETDPKNLAATFGAALVANARKDVPAADAMLIKATTDHPESVQARLALAQHYVATARVDRARALMDQAIAKNPKSADFANARGIVMMAARDPAAAVASFEKAAELAPKRVDLALNLARAQVAKGDVKTALATLDQALITSPRDLSLLGFATATSIASEDIERASGYVERARKAAPGSAASSRLEGDLAMAQRRYRDAIAAYDKADPSGRDRATVLARFNAADRSKAPNADSTLVRWIEKNPGDVEVVTTLGEYKRAQGDLAGAAAVYRRALTGMPDDAILNNNLAYVYGELGDARAVPVAERAVKAAPNSPAVQDTYGWVLLRSGKTEQALPVLRDAAGRLPDNAEVQYHYAAALARTGRDDEAMQLLKRALGGSLPADTRADAQKLLSQLSG
jgi:putative PEP-CTERM system TPR-repeat lipoprotein